MGHWMTDVNGDDYYVGETINTPMQSMTELLKREMYCHVKENKYGWWSCECGQFFLSNCSAISYLDFDKINSNYLMERLGDL